MGLKLSQQMWTPAEIELEAPQSTDRPYAGYLAIESHTVHYGNKWALKNWFSLGVIGPASGAQQVQEFVHKITGSSPPLGWQYQIENQVTLQLAYELDGLLLRRDAFNNAFVGQTQWELSGFSHTQAGNFRTETDLGLTLRWGNNLEDSFGRLSQHRGHMGNLTSTSNRNTFILYSRAFVGYRFNDLSLAGSLPYESDLKLENKQAGFTTGIIWSQPTWSVGWSFNTYTKEHQADSAKWHGYGSLLFSWYL
ncbi:MULTISPECIES: lipid A deacylase LpxR family protein [unclassified Shewanella]|uniref:lipid A deacylase LpxR family protein n=1 Tax=unclassified Shewanella TaxID=196818 RepID=UPI0022BA1BDC|nr:MULTISPECIES: lipid A deacylase LpxR family protein [unclassified Shewanella]